MTKHNCGKHILSFSTVKNLKAVGNYVSWEHGTSFHNMGRRKYKWEDDAFTPPPPPPLQKPRLQFNSVARSTFQMCKWVCGVVFFLPNTYNLLFSA